MSEPSAPSERTHDPVDEVSAERRRSRSRWWTIGLPALVAFLVSMVFGVTTATAELSLGPHQARYDVTTDSLVTVDLGPLGTLQLASPLPLTLGVHVTVEEIPDSFTAVDAATTLQALSGDLQGYLQFFAGPQATVHDATRALIADAAWRAAGSLVVLGLGWLGVRWLMGQARRDELADAIAPHARQITASVLVAGLGLGVLTSSLGEDARPAEEAHVSAVFDGTPLEGARVTGRLGGVIDTYGGYVVEAYRSNAAFYEAAEQSLQVAWREREASIAQAAEQAKAGPSVRTDPGVQPAPEAGSAADVVSSGAEGLPEGAPGVAATPSPTPSPTSAPRGERAEPVVLLVISDLHCNVGMAPVIRSLAELSDAQVILDAGDTSINGTAVEQYCVTTFAQAAPSGVPVVTSPGNHDSRETSAMYARSGATVLAGDVVEVAGVRILGDRDPNETRLGSGTSTADEETAAEMGARLAETACADEDGVDLLLVHTPRVGQAALDGGCVPAQVSGHLHRRVGPALVGEGVRYISSSTAGASAGQATVGPLNGVAEMTVLRFDPDRREVLDYQVVQVRTDASVEVGPRAAWPSRSPLQSQPRSPLLVPLD